MTTVVRFLRRGTVVVESTISGQLLPVSVPRSVALKDSPGRIDLVESSDGTLECCGRISLVALRDDNVFSVSHIDVPPPDPFSSPDLREMWEARNRLDLKQRPPTSGDATWFATVLRPRTDVRMDRLPSAIASARMLLSRWPTTPATHSQVLPLGQPGGREDLRSTDILASQRGTTLHQNRPLPAETARVFGSAVRRTCGSVAMLAELLRFQADILLRTPEAIPVEHDRRAVLAPLAAVAVAAQIPKGTVDGPPSTWPTGMQKFYSLASIALAELEILGSGADTAPLSELWDLYQAWVAEAILGLMVSQLGPPIATSTSSLLGRWVSGRVELELHYTPLIPSRPGKSKSISGAKLHAAIGALEPDVVIAARNLHTGQVKLLVIDPKKRKYLDSGALTVESSKYLWGIRGDANLLGVVLVAPSGGVSADRLDGRAWTIESRPGELGLTSAMITNWIQLVSLG